MTVINKKLNASYNMLAPEIAADADLKTEIFFPTSEAVSPPVLGNAATVKVQREKTVICLGTLSANCTLHLKPQAENINVGALVVINWKSDATARNVAVKENNSALITFTGAANGDRTQLLIWNGSTLLPVS